MSTKYLYNLIDCKTGETIMKECGYQEVSRFLKCTKTYVNQAARMKYKIRHRYKIEIANLPDAMRQYEKCLNSSWTEEMIQEWNALRKLFLGHA